MFHDKALLTTLAVALASTSSLVPPSATAALAHEGELTLRSAKRIVAVATAQARQDGAGGAFAVTDAGGTLLYLERLDGTFAAAATVAVGKARTAAMFQKPTRVFEDAINKGRTAMAGLPVLPDFTPLQGGVPLLLGGRVVGAIGVSGAKSAQHDDDLAVAAANALASAVGTVAGGSAGGCACGGDSACCAEPSTPDVAHFDKATVDGAFAKGAPLLEVAGFKIHASRRTAPGEAEVHARETDVIYVLQGTATFVTGGAVVGGRTTAPDEVRGSAIDGGAVREIKAGDVVVVPAGTPHWFRDVRGPVLYYVVKVL
jgi:glc operon protein GlcG